MQTERYFKSTRVALTGALLAMFFLSACQQTQQPAPSAAESKALSVQASKVQIKRAGGPVDIVNRRGGGERCRNRGSLEQRAHYQDANPPLRPQPNRL